MPYKQSHPIAAFREIVFSLRNSSGVPVTGQTFATTDLQLRKPGAGSFVNCGNEGAVVEIGGGDYVYTFLTGELDTPGTGGVFKVNKTGAVQVDYGIEIERAYFATSITGTLTASGFTTDRTEATDGYWNYAVINCIAGVNLGQVKKVALIGGYIGATKFIGLQPGQAFTSAPANGDLFELIVR